MQALKTRFSPLARLVAVAALCLAGWSAAPAANAESGAHRLPPPPPVHTDIDHGSHR